MVHTNKETHKQLIQLERWLDVSLLNWFPLFLMMCNGVCLIGKYVLVLCMWHISSDWLIDWLIYKYYIECNELKPNKAWNIWTNMQTLAHKWKTNFLTIQQANKQGMNNWTREQTFGCSGGGSKLEQDNAIHGSLQLGNVVEICCGCRVRRIGNKQGWM